MFKGGRLGRPLVSGDMLGNPEPKPYELLRPLRGGNGVKGGRERPDDELDELLRLPDRRVGERGSNAERPDDVLLRCRLVDAAGTEGHVPLDEYQPVELDECCRTCGRNGNQPQVSRLKVLVTHQVRTCLV